MKTTSHKLTAITLACLALLAIAAGFRISEFQQKLTLADTNLFELSVPGDPSGTGSWKVAYGALASNIAARIGVTVPLSSGGAGGSWIINEEFLGDATTRSVGREPWTTSMAGGGAMEFPTNFPGAIGVKGLVVTNASTDRAGFLVQGLFNGLTNAEYFFSARVAVGTLDGGGATNAWKVGLCDSVTSVAGASGVWFRNASNQWWAVAQRNNVAFQAPLSNSVSYGFVTLAWHLDAAGTNVDFYMGGSDGVLTWQTNAPVANIPAPGLLLTAQCLCYKLSGVTERMTNYIDNFRLWARSL